MNVFSGAVKPDSITVDGYEPDIHAHRYSEIPSNMQMRLDYGTRSDGQAVYMGWAARGLTTANDGWLLHKCTYDTNSMMTLRQIAYNSWDNRASATYA